MVQPACQVREWFEVWLVARCGTLKRACWSMRASTRTLETILFLQFCAWLSGLVESRKKKLWFGGPQFLEMLVWSITIFYRRMIWSMDMANSCGLTVSFQDHRIERWIDGGAWFLRPDLRRRVEPRQTSWPGCPKKNYGKVARSEMKDALFLVGKTMIWTLYELIWNIHKHLLNNHASGYANRLCAVRNLENVIWFDLIWFDLIWFDLTMEYDVMWFDLLQFDWEWLDWIWFWLGYCWFWFRPNDDDDIHLWTWRSQ